MQQTEKGATSSLPTDLDNALTAFEQAVNRKVNKVRIRQFIQPIFRLFGF